MNRPGPDPLKPFQWKARVLVVSAPSPADPSYRAQEQALASDLAGQADRELLVVRLVGAASGGRPEDATVVAFRERLSIAPHLFEVVLVGLDGMIALRRRQPLTLEELFARIDAMPMRRELLRKRNAAQD